MGETDKKSYHYTGENMSAELREDKQVCADCCNPMIEETDETLSDGIDEPVIYFCPTCDKYWQPKWISTEWVIW
tara:strand:+ start:868 stop:1089 length:222 start_codon:yes stop_codon:yes gene_type:complete